MTRKSIFGLQENVAGALCYSLMFFSGIVILVMEKENKFVRFHALQSTLWFMLLSVARFILRFFVGWIPFVGGLLDSFFVMLIIATWLLLMVNAYLGKQFKLPIIGDIVEAQIGR